MNAAQLIEQYFAANQDGEFSLPSRELAFTVIGPKRQTSKILYSPKVDASALLFNENHLLEHGWIARYGLPDSTDSTWLKHFIGKRTLLFLGDMDPPDLLIFAWLRHKLKGLKLRHIGVNDRLVLACEVKVSNRCTIPCGVSERKAMPLLDKVWPEWPDTVGPTCAALLSGGRKLELEAAFSFGVTTQIAGLVKQGS